MENVSLKFLALPHYTSRVLLKCGAAVCRDQAILFKGLYVCKTTSEADLLWPLSVDLVAWMEESILATTRSLDFSWVWVTENGCLPSSVFTAQGFVGPFAGISGARASKSDDEKREETSGLGGRTSLLTWLVPAWSQSFSKAAGVWYASSRFVTLAIRTCLAAGMPAARSLDLSSEDRAANIWGQCVWRLSRTFCRTGLEILEAKFEGKVPAILWRLECEREYKSCSSSSQRRTTCFSSDTTSSSSTATSKSNFLVCRTCPEYIAF